jgi:cobalt transporter subunit CbtB
VKSILFSSPSAIDARTTAKSKAAALAFAIGLGLVYLAGFSQMASVHDAAHDSRHALAFPCH